MAPGKRLGSGAVRRQRQTTETVAHTTKRGDRRAGSVGGPFPLSRTEGGWARVTLGGVPFKFADTLSQVVYAAL